MNDIDRAKKVLMLTDYFFSLPPTEYFMFAILFLSIGFGILFSLFTQYDSIHTLIFNGILEGLVVLSIPSFLTAISAKIMMRKIPFNRIVATTFVGMFMYGVTYVAVKIASYFSPSLESILLFFGVGIVFLLWYLIARIVFVLKWRSVLFASIQLLFNAVFLLASTSIQPGGTFSVNIIKFYIASFILLGATYLFFVIINAPMKRSFGISSIDAISMFLAQWFYESKEMESAFDEISEEAETYLSVLDFKRKDKEILFIVPYIHFGPFGNLGGSEFSEKLIAHFDRGGKDVFVFHGPSTHDNNPSSSDQIQNVIKTIEKMRSEMKHEHVNASFFSGEEEECKSHVLMFGKHAFVGLSRAPETTEDINLGVGIALTNYVEKFVENGVIVDEHNAETGDVTSVEPGDPIIFKYQRAIEDAFSKAKKQTPLMIGTWKKCLKDKEVGGGGIRIAVFKTSPYFFLISIDSNGIEPLSREKIVEEAQQFLKRIGLKGVVEVFTTDTHKTNVVRGVLNPVRYNRTLMREILRGMEAAIKDIKPASFSGKRSIIQMEMLGAKRSAEIISTVNAIVATAKIAAPILIIGTVIILLLAISMV